MPPRFPLNMPSGLPPGTYHFPGGKKLIVTPPLTIEGRVPGPVPIPCPPPQIPPTRLPTRPPIPPPVWTPPKTPIPRPTPPPVWTPPKTPIPRPIPPPVWTPPKTPIPRPIPPPVWTPSKTLLRIGTTKGALGKTKDVTGLKSPWFDPTDLFTFGVGGAGAKAGSKGVSLLGRIIGRIFAKRSASPVAGLATRDIVGPFGRLTYVEIQKAIATSGGRTVELYTKLSLAPAAGRAISFATDRTLAEAARSGGQVFVVRIPDVLLRKLEYIGVAVRTTTAMGGRVGTEIRILPVAADIVRGFLVQ